MTGEVRPGFLLVLLVAAAPGLQSQDVQPAAPLPASEAFLAEARENLERARRDTQLSYTERRTELHMNPFGRIGSGEAGRTIAYHVSPSPDGSWVERKLIERDGKPVEDGEVTRRAVRPLESSRNRRPAVDDTVNALEFTLDRREVLHGRSTVVVAFRPRPNARPETDQGRMAKSFRGHIWVDETLREVVHVEATAIDTLSFGFGMVARLNKGSTVELTRQQVVPGAWQATSMRFTGEGRALLVRKLRLNHVIEWFNYRRVE